MNEFKFRGDISSSKSIYNRALIVQSYFSELTLRGHSQCDDVVHMQAALENLYAGREIDCGEGGTTFRFLALRLSRIPGQHILRASSRLIQRPQRGLLDLLHQLGVEAKIEETRLVLSGQGWKPSPQPLKIDMTESSQYASALVLNSWSLDFPLEFELVGEKVSESYFNLTLELLKAGGLNIKKTPRGFLILENQKITSTEWEVEADLSSTFTVAAAAALGGFCHVTNFPSQSLQPDAIFVDILKKMNVEVEISSTGLVVHRCKNLRAIDWNLSQSPDLFPVLAVLCAFSQGVSTLFGAPHLTKKESNRIQRVADLLTMTGVRHEIKTDGMVIYGQPRADGSVQASFNPDKDHRMVMAATLMNIKGHHIHIEEPSVINKSFPEFWSIFGDYK